MKAAHSDRQPEPLKLPRSAGPPLAVELRHLRYFVSLADAGSFTRAAEQMFIAQPTLSQQIRRLEEIVGAPLLQRRRDGVRLTKAGTVLLDASRAVLSLVDQEVNRTRQAAGLGRQHLRVVVPPGLPDTLAVEVASRLKSAAAAANVEIVWIETPLDADFSLIRQRRADAGLGWLTVGREALPLPLDVMGLAEFEPDVWIPSSDVAARRGTISLAELAHMDVVYGPRRAEPGTYDAWTQVLRTADSRFGFSDPPLRHSLQMNLAFAATADRPTAVLTGPSVIAGSRPRLIRLPRSAVTHEMVRVILEHRPLAATAALVWIGDLPRTLQQILFDTAESIIFPGPTRQVEPGLKAMSLSVTHLGQALSACVHWSDPGGTRRREGLAMTAASQPQLVTLGSGDVVRIRQVRPDDASALARAYANLGEQSRYRRFFTVMPELPEATLKAAVEVDHVDHEALVAVPLLSTEIVGESRFIRLPDQLDTAEVGVTVVDAWQGRGLGPALLACLSEHALAAGIEYFTAEILAENRTMLALLPSLGQVETESRGPVVAARVELGEPSGQAHPDLLDLLTAASRGDIVSFPVLLRRLIRVPDGLTHIVRLPVSTVLKMWRPGPRTPDAPDDP
jgi:DNA-binding transcriptional LysR family regulator/RimJ/RimL family protein N-acetyltransferase